MDCPDFTSVEMVENLPLKGADSVAVESVDKPSQCPDLMRENMEGDYLAKCSISGTKKIVDKSREECSVSTSATASINSQSLATDNNEMLPEDSIVIAVLPNPIPNLKEHFSNDSFNFENATTFTEDVKKQLSKLGPCQPLAHHLDGCTFPRTRFGRNRHSFPESWYKHILSNGTSIDREWLEYSRIKDSIFRFFLAHVWFSISTYCGKKMGFCWS